MGANGYKMKNNKLDSSQNTNELLSELESISEIMADRISDGQYKTIESMDLRRKKLIELISREGKVLELGRDRLEIIKSNNDKMITEINFDIKQKYSSFNNEKKRLTAYNKQC